MRCFNSRRSLCMRASFGGIFWSVACFRGSHMLRASSTSVGLGLGMVISPPRQCSWTRLLIRRVREPRSETTWSSYERLRKRRTFLSCLTAAPMTTRAERGAVTEGVASINSKKATKGTKGIDSAYAVCNTIHGLCNGM